LLKPRRGRLPVSAAIKHLARRIHFERQTLYSLEEVVLVPPFRGPSHNRHYMIKR
jgi:hypothetical protein